MKNSQCPFPTLIKCSGFIKYLIFFYQERRLIDEINSRNLFKFSTMTSISL